MLFHHGIMSKRIRGNQMFFVLQGFEELRI